MILLDDGRMAFLDFGLFKRIPADVAEFELKTQRMGIERRSAELKQFMYESGWIGEPSRYPEDKVQAMFDDLTGWFTIDGFRRLGPEDATELVITMGDPRSKYFGSMRHETLPPDHLFGRRLEMLTFAVMAQLRAGGNWHRIAREWVYGDEPETELGREEAAFYAGAHA
jgi:hypothetical protein